MPSLPSSAPSAPGFSPSAVFGVLAFVLAVIGVSCLYLAALHLSDKMAERRARTTDVKKAGSDAFLVVGAMESRPIIEISRKTVATAALVAARKNLPIPTADKPKARIVVNFVKILANIEPRCNLKKLNGQHYEVLARFDTSRRRTLHGISPLRIVLACDTAMAPIPLPRLQHTRIYSVDKIERASIISPIIPIASVLKPSVRHALLKQLDESSVDPTRYIMRRSHPQPRPSRLRIVHPTTPPSPSRIVEGPSVLGASQLGNVSRSALVKQPAAKLPKRSPASTPTKRRATPNKENGRRRMLV